MVFLSKSLEQGSSAVQVYIYPENGVSDYSLRKALYKLKEILKQQKARKNGVYCQGL